jgi:hypothetical protein
VIFGAMNLWTGSRLFLVREHQRAGDFQAFLRLLHPHYRGWPVVLLLDADSSPSAVGSEHWAWVFGIQLIWLPKRSPKLNPMDHLGGTAKMKSVLTSNRQPSMTKCHVSSNT